EESTRNKNEITITNENRRLSAQQIRRLIQEAEKYKADDQKYEKKVKAMNALDDYVYKRKLLPQDKVKIKLAIAKARNLLDASQQTETEVFEDYLNELKTLSEPIVKIS
ncbi:Heat shock cognate 70 kDa protein 2, partial [Mucuna pruriens]